MSRRDCKDCGQPAADRRSRCFSCYGKARRAKVANRLAGRTGLKILALDIETRPNRGFFWGLWDQNIGLNQLEESVEMMCFAAKWLGDEGTMFFSEQGGRERMLVAAHALINEADVVIHYNGRKFDMRHLNREFVQAGFSPPRPYKQIDLLSVVKQRFLFPSNKLEYVSTALGLAGKVKHEGFELWLKCMAGDAEAWAGMEAYNRQDVELLEELYHILLPWIPNHPHRWLYDGEGGCPTCGSDETLVAAGYARTKLSKFKQFRCTACGGFFRSSRRELGVQIQESVA